MPDDNKPEVVIDDLNQNAKDEQEFEDTFDDIMTEGGKDSDKRLEEEPKADVDVKDASPGEGTKDPDPEAPAEGDKPVSEESDKDPVVEDTPTTDPDVSFWMDRAREAEAALTKEQQRTKSWDGRIGAANKRAQDAEEKATELEAQLAKRGTDGDGSTSSESDDVDDVLKLFPEMKPLVDKLNNQIAAQQKVIEGITQKEPILNDPEPEPEPVKQTTQSANIDAVTAARKTITDAHPDFNSVMSSGKLEPWIASQPDHIRPRLQEIYRTGTAAEVVSMTSTFKKETGWKTPVTRDTDDKKKKLDALKEVNSEGSGPPSSGPDMNDYEATAKEIGLS